MRMPLARRPNVANVDIQMRPGQGADGMRAARRVLAAVTYLRDSR
jgi:hypothetical protein